MTKMGFVFIVLLFSIQFSCVKKKLPPKKIETIQPLPYLPAFPGSYWKYSNGDTYTTSATYKKDVYSVFYGSNLVYTADTFYVPIYNGAPLWGYKVHDEYAIVWPNEQTTPLVRIISDSLPTGANWRVARSGNHSGVWVYISAKDTSISISGKDYYPTIVLYYKSIVNNDRQIPYKRAYYTKNIGLVKEELLSWMDSSVISEKHIVDYFINR